MPLTISRDDRDVLHAEARRTLDALDDVGLRRPVLATAQGADVARRQARRLQRAFAMLDILGWAEADPRDTYQLRIEETVVQWLRVTHEEIHNHLPELDEVYTAQRSGDEDSFEQGCTREESMAITRAAQDQEEALADLLERLLSAMFESSAAVVA